MRVVYSSESKLEYKLTHWSQRKPEKPQQKDIGIQVGVGGTVSDESSGSESDQDIQHPENAMALPNSTTCKTKDSPTSPDPDEICLIFENA